MRRISFFCLFLCAAAPLASGTISFANSVPPKPVHKPQPPAEKPARAATPVKSSAAATPEETAKPAVREAGVLLPVRRPAGLGDEKPPQVAASSDDTALPVTDMDETSTLPPYPQGARTAVGKFQTYRMGEEDTILDVARHFRLGYVETRAANPAVDPWTPVPGEPVIIPAFRLLPRAAQNGIVVNLAQMRMYYFRDAKQEPLAFPIGIGREGLQTPTGETEIVRKVAGPSWFPTERMREEKPWLPVSVPAGPSNPLGTHALYLGWPTFLIHGSNKPWAIGRRVSSGCMRMYPEDISSLFNTVPVGTKVTVVDQPILVGWVGETLYLEANPSRTQSNEIEVNGEHTVKGLNDALRKVITTAAGIPAEQIDWDTVRKAIEERFGYPVAIAGAKTPPAATPPQKKPSHTEYQFNG